MTFNHSRFGAIASIAAAALAVAGGAYAQTRAVDVSRFAGPKILVTAKTARPVGAEVQNVTINPELYVLARWSAANIATKAVQAPGGEAVAAGYGFIGVLRDGREIRFRPVIEIASPLRVGDDGRFLGRIFVGLQDLSDPSARYDLPTAVSLLLNGQVDAIAPQQLSMTHTSLPFTEVSIAAADPRDAVQLHLQAAGTNERATVTLDVLRPALHISPARSRIQGFGFERVDVAVHVSGLQRPGGRQVFLSSDPGSFEPSQVTLNDQGTAIASLRSVSVGTAALRASSPALSDASATVRFSWPVATLVASVIGGLAGALLRRLQRGRVRSLRALTPILAAGLISGVVVIALYAVGVSVLPIQPVANAGEVLIFALAAVGGYLGLQINDAARR